MDNPLRPGERVMDRIAGFAREISRKVAEEVQKLRDQPAQLDDGGIGGIPFQRNLVQQVAASDVPLEVRLQRFRQVLAADRIDMDELRRLAMGGVPTQEGMRAVTWKLLLNYLPRQTSQWEAELKRKRDQYQQFCDELIIDPKTTASSSSSAAAAAAAGAGASSSGGGDVTSCHPLQAQDVTQDDHPLSLNHGSRWLEYFKDSETLQQIQRDVIRTHPDIEFFCGEGPDAAEHRDHMQRALFIYAKLNAGERRRNMPRCGGGGGGGDGVTKHECCST